MPRSLLSVCTGIVILCAPDPAVAADLEPSNPKVARARSVLDQLVDSSGPVGPRHVRPRLLVRAMGSRGPQRIAWTEPKADAIVIDEKLYDLLRDSRDIALEDGLALILGHELAHVRLHEGWNAAYGLNSSDASTSGLEPAEVELEADELGTFLAFVAGFDTLGLGPRVVDAIYAGYGLDDTLGDYPPRSKRRAIAADADADAVEAAALYTAGFLSAAGGAPGAALALFEHLARRYPSSAVLDAAAVSALLRVMELDHDDRRLPIGFSVPHGLGEGVVPKVGVAPPRIRQTHLIRRARLHLAAVLAQGPAAPQWHVHIGALELLDERPKAALDAAARVDKLNRGRGRSARLEAEAWLLRGWALKSLGRSAESRRSFRRARALGSAIPQLTARAPASAGTDSRPLPPVLAAQTRTVPADDGPLELTWGHADPLPTQLELRHRRRIWRWAATEAGDGARTPAGLQKGDSTARLLKLHGAPHAETPAGRGRVLRFGEREGILVWLRADRVEGWWRFEQRPEEP